MLQDECYKVTYTCEDNAVGSRFLGLRRLGFVGFRANHVQMAGLQQIQGSVQA